MINATIAIPLDDHLLVMGYRNEEKLLWRVRAL